MKISKMGILGTGKMGGAIVRGLQKNTAELELLAYDTLPDPDLANLCQYVDSLSALNACDLVLLCVKSSDLQNVISQLNGQALYVSIAAGVSIKQIDAYFKGIPHEKIARAMPNLPATIGRSMTAVFANDPALRTLVRQIFESIGSVVELREETEMHAFTGLCGSGPAFAYAFVQAMSEGGVLAGLNYERSLKITIEMLEGSLALLKESGEHPSVWRNRVTSPGGTTIAGLAELEQAGFHHAIMRAIASAAARSSSMQDDN